MFIVYWILLIDTLGYLNDLVVRYVLLTEPSVQRSAHYVRLHQILRPKSFGLRDNKEKEEAFVLYLSRSPGSIIGRTNLMSYIGVCIIARWQNTM